MKTPLRIFALLVLTTLQLRSEEAAVLPTPGPEDGGLRLRLVVVPRADSAKEGYEVRMDLLNVSEREVTLRAGWYDDDPGSVNDYLEAATSIECVPAVLPWMGGVLGPHRTSPQPEEVLKPGAVLSVRWQTEGRHLKNRVVNPNEVQNPEFPLPGLYSVHASIRVITPERIVPLRSNEQLVPVGGSNAFPKSTLGQLGEVASDGKTAMLMLGAQQKVEAGDQFEHFSKGGNWKLTITRVEPIYSFGTLEMITPSPLSPPVRGATVSLILKK